MSTFSVQELTLKIVEEENQVEDVDDSPVEVVEKEEPVEEEETKPEVDDEP